LLAVFGLAGCGGSGGNKPDTQNSSQDRKVETTQPDVENNAPLVNTIKGITFFDGGVSGAEVTVSLSDGEVLAATTSEENGEFSLSFDQEIESDDCLFFKSSIKNVISGDVILTTASYCNDFSDKLVISPITTILDRISESYPKVLNIQERKKQAKDYMISLGMISKNDDWNSIDSQNVNYQGLSSAIENVGGFENWLTYTLEDLIDNQVSAPLVKQVFTLAHGGIQFITAENVQIFPNQNRSFELAVVMSDESIREGENFLLTSSHDWVSQLDGVLNINPTGEVEPGTYTYSIEVQSDDEVVNRKQTFEVEILNEIILLEGSLGLTGGDIRNQFQDIIISVEPGVLADTYQLKYMVTVSNDGSIVTNLTTVPAMSTSESLGLVLTEPSVEIIKRNYIDPVINRSSVSSFSSVRRMSNAVEENYESATCDASEGDIWQDRNRDGFGFNYVWTCSNAQYIDYDASLKSKNGGLPHTFVSIIPDQNLITKRAFVLRGNHPSTDVDNTRIPVLFVHGFINTGKLGGYEFKSDNPNEHGGEYFSVFPKLIDDYVGTNGERYQPFIFQWRTNVPFEHAAHHLGSAIQKIVAETGQPVHIIAHSYGGVVARALIQGLSFELPSDSESKFSREFLETNIASLTTVGTPHSGIFPSEESVELDGKSVNFLDGTDRTLAGGFIRFCEAINCYQAGGNTDEPQDLLSEDVYDNGRDKILGIRENKGATMHKLSVDLMGNGWPNIKTQVLIGLVSEENKYKKNGVIEVVESPHDVSNRSRSSLGDDYRWPSEYYITTEGDSLISVGGQRFNSTGIHGNLAYGKSLLNFESNQFPGSFNISEHFLGFQEFNESFISDADFFRNYTNGYFSYLIDDDDIYIDGDPDPSEATLSETFVSYNHRTGEAGGVMRSEVGLQDCMYKDVADCRHNTWQYFVSFLDIIQPKDIVPVTNVILSGRITNLSEIDFFDVDIKINDQLQSGIVPDFELDGSFSIELPFFQNSEYQITILPELESGFRSVNFSVETANTQQESLLELGSRALPLSQFALGTIFLEVVDAQTGVTIENYTSIISNNTQTAFYSDNDDVTAGIQLTQNEYMFAISSDGYFTRNKSCTAIAQQNNICRIELLNDNFSVDGSGTLITVLSWDLEPSDLDSHMAKYDISGNETYHIYYSSSTDSDTGDNLDTDDTDSYGPETITIDSVDSDAVYVYYVHHYSGAGSISTTSLAQVEVTRIGDSENPVTSSTYRAPSSGEGDYWKVFEIRNAIVYPCVQNCLMSSSPSYSSLRFGGMESDTKPIHDVPLEIKRSLDFE
jgi:hypothetical protein